MRNAISNHLAASAERFDGEDNNDDDRKEKGEEELEDDIDVSTADSYSHLVVIIRMH